MQRMKSIALLFLLACAVSQAGTRVRDTVYYATGKRADGRITITWPAFTSGAKTVAAGTLDVRVSNGVLDVELEPTPAGISYTARYYLNNGVSNLEYWIVPTSATPVTVAAIRTATIPTPNLQISVGQIGQSGAQTGQCLAWTGTSWQPVDCAIAGVVDATRIQGRDVATTAPGGGMVLTWNATAGRWEPQGLTATTPVDGQMLRFDGASGRWQTVTVVDQETPSGVLDGVNTVFTLASAPSPANGLILFRNGIVQKRGFDYTLLGNTITFVPAATPQPEDVLLAWYRF